MLEHIVAVFDNDGPAAAAERALGEAGIPSSAVRRYSTGDTTRTGDTTTHDTATGERSGGGFWSWLLGEDTSTAPGYDRDMDYYDRRAQAGSTILSVTIAEDSQIHRAVEIIESYDPVQIDERTEEEERDTSAVGTSTAGREFSTGDASRASDARGTSMAAGPYTEASTSDRTTGKTHRVEGGHDETNSAGRGAA